MSIESGRPMKKTPVVRVKKLLPQHENFEVDIENVDDNRPYPFKRPLPVDGPFDLGSGLSATFGCKKAKKPRIRPKILGSVLNPCVLTSKKPDETATTLRNSANDSQYTVTRKGAKRPISLFEATGTKSELKNFQEAQGDYERAPRLTADVESNIPDEENPYLHNDRFRGQCSRIMPIDYLRKRFGIRWHASGWRYFERAMHKRGESNVLVV